MKFHKITSQQMRTPSFSFLFLFLLIGCQEREKVSTLFELRSSSDTGIDFINEVIESREMNILTYRNFYNGGGIAVGDINNDGLPDLYFTANQKENKLYLNEGNFKFKDITKSSKSGGTKSWSTGVSMTDVNADGWLDIYVCNSGDFDGAQKENELFINNQDGTFTEMARAFNLNNTGYGTHAAFFDFDLDGDLDCYILNNSFKEPDKIELYQSMRDIPDTLGGDKLMRNDGNFFTDITLEAGIYSSRIGFGLGVATGDLNGDLLPDLYVSNDFWERDYLYLNNGDGTFKEDLNNRINYCSVSSMGADIGDINGDGNPEIFTTDMLPADNYRIKTLTSFEPYHLEDIKYRGNYHYQMIQNCLHLNDGSANFQEIALLSGVSATDWSWGALFFDFENDGVKDIFVSNGINRDIISGDFREFLGQPETQELVNTGEADKDLRQLTSQIPSNPLANFAFSQSSPLKFENKAKELGLDKPSFSNGSVYTDLDNDGDLDLVVNNVNMESFVYENLSQGNNFLKIQFAGSIKNPFGIGAKIIVETENQKIIAENFINRGFESSIEPQLLIGLGHKDIIKHLTVIWPDKSFQILEQIPVNQIIKLAHKNAGGVFHYPDKEENTWFTEITTSVLPREAIHVENNYNDFELENLLNQMLSTEGPRLIPGDANGDGLDDFVLLGAKNDADKIFIQQKNGRFRFKRDQSFETDKGFESTCGAFLDYDLDGDKDLLIGSGGNQTNVDQINYIVRLYVNDGKGNYTVDPAHIPPVVGNFSTLEVSDFDQDGDPDFFLGARVIPGNYGLTPQSHLFKNENGSWRSIGGEAIGKLGMVTDAIWEDTDSDGDVDLLVVGDWMEIKVFKNNKGVLDAPISIPNTSGFWQRIESQDLDGDNDMDFILGNWGLNSKFQASISLPITMNVSDFDGNGKSEPIINWIAPADKEAFPYASKMEITSQMPELKKKNLKFSEFAKMKVSDFNLHSGSENLALKAENLQTGVLWNEAGKFSFSPLPLEAQISPVFGITTKDFNKDGILDIWLGGNFYGLKPQSGRHDASRGILLQGMGDKKFSYIPNSEAGINIKGQIRDVLVFGERLIIARNNESVKVYSLD
ncbi:MAG: hypothetical protein ACI9DJ_002783 [Algoriphagus sp.]|jgi:hypothetical protein